MTVNKKIIENHLSPKAQIILSEREERRLKELEQQKKLATEEAFRKTYEDKYRLDIQEALNRFLSEEQYCKEIYLEYILPPLLEIKKFAETNSIFPEPTDSDKQATYDKTPTLPIASFFISNTPYIEKKLKFYSRGNDSVINEYKKRVEDLSQQHLSVKCGIEWGYNMHERSYSGEDGWGNSYYHDDYYIICYGINLSINHNGNVELLDKNYTRDEFDTESFIQVLCEAFYHPVITNKKTSNREEKTPEQPAKTKFAKTSEGLRNFAKSFVAIWKEPKEETRASDSLIKKLWYGFPTKQNSEKDNDEFDF
jgi:hypothetical protein